MKDYMVAHTFKSEEHRAKHFEASSQLTLEYMREHMKSDSVPSESGNLDEMVTSSLVEGRKPSRDIIYVGRNG